MCILLKEEKMNITIPDEARGFKLAAIRFHDIAVIDMDDRFIREPFADGEKVWFLRFSRNPFIQMPGEPLYGIDLLGTFVELVYDVGQQATSGSKDAVSHISSKLFVRF